MYNDKDFILNYPFFLEKEVKKVNYSQVLTNYFQFLVLLFLSKIILIALYHNVPQCTTNDPFPKWLLKECKPNISTHSRFSENIDHPPYEPCLSPLRQSPVSLCVTCSGNSTCQQLLASPHFVISHIKGPSNLTCTLRCFNQSWIKALLWLCRPCLFFAAQVQKGAIIEGLQW